MPKSFRRYKKSSKHKLSSRKLSSRKLSSRKLRRGHEEKVKCCMCEKMVSIKNTFVPIECLMKHGKTSHHICKDCWWDPDTGFALESSSHKCPGCQKGLPLTEYKQEAPIFIDLTED